MNSDSLDNYFSWLPVINTVKDRVKNDSLIHMFSYKIKIRENTKNLNKFLKTYRPKCYSDFVKCKQDILNKITSNVDVSDDSELSDSDIKTFYSSFNESSAANLKTIHNDLFVWSFIEKKGLKIIEPENDYNSTIWEPTIDISIENCHSQAEGQAKCNVNFKAARALPMKNKNPKKKSKKNIYHNTRNSSSSNSINNNINCINVSKKFLEKYEEEVEKKKTSATKVLRTKKINGLKRNLKPTIHDTSPQSLENTKDFSCDFIHENFQAQSTQIFSDTFIDTSIQINNQTRQAHKFASNHTNNQPRDSCIEEDSRAGNIIHQNIKNGTSKNNKQNTFFSKNTESCNNLRKNKTLKIIGNETLIKKYKIVATNNKESQPIIEEKNVSLSGLNNKNNDYSNHKLRDSESDFKSIESDNEEENFDECYDIPDDIDTLKFEDDQASHAEGSWVTNHKETCVEYDSQDSEHYCKRMTNESVKSTSPWITKQYDNLKQLRLLNTSVDDSEIDSNEKNQSNTIAEQTVSTKNKNIPKIFINETEKSSEIQSKKEKSFVNGTLTRHLDLEINTSQISNEHFNKNANVDTHNDRKNESSFNQTDSFCKNGGSLNSKLDNNNVYCSESDGDSQKSFQKIKKLKYRKKQQKTNILDLPSNREQLYERQLQHDLKNVKSYKSIYSTKCINNDDIKEGIHQNCEEDVFLDLHVENLTKLKIKSASSKLDHSKKNSYGICSKYSSSHRNSSVSSIEDLPITKYKKENRLNDKILTTSNDKKENEDEKIISEHQKKKLQKLKKIDLIASDETSDRETQLEKEKIGEKIEIKLQKAYDSEIDNYKITETMLSHKESPSNIEDDVLPTQQAQKKIQQMKRLNFIDSNESERNESETVSINRHEYKSIKPEPIKEQSTENFEKVKKAICNENNVEDDKMPRNEKKYLQQIKKINGLGTNVSEDLGEHQVLKNISRKISNEKIQLISAKEQTFNDKSKKTHKLTEEVNNEKDIISVNQVKHLQQKKKMDVPTDNSEESNKGDQVLKSRNKEIFNEKTKREDSENENIKSNKKTKLLEKCNADLHEERDSDIVYHDSDNVDIKEHKVTIPKELKHSNLLDYLNESNVERFDLSLNDDEFQKHLQKKNVGELVNDDDEEIDNIIPVEVSKRMQQLKRLNLYEDNDSSDSDEVLIHNRSDRNISRNRSSVSRNAYDDSSSDETENISKDPLKSIDELNESELNDTKGKFQDNITNEEDNDEQNMNVIIPETQESVDIVSDNIQSQEVFSFPENLAKCSSSIPATPKSVLKKSSPTELVRKKITEITELVEQDELTKSSLKPTIILDDISDDEEIFFIDVPKHLFDQNIIGKKLIVSNSSLTIGESNYKIYDKDIPPIMTCVIKSKKKKYKTVNVRPLFSIIAQGKINGDEFYGTESTSIEKSNSKNLKLSLKDKLHSTSSIALKDGIIAKKKRIKNKKINLNLNDVDDIENFKKITGQGIASTSKVPKRKLYESDHEMKDLVDSRTTESIMNTNSSLKKLKELKERVKDTVDTSIKSAVRVSTNEPTLKNINVNEPAPNNENKSKVEISTQSKSKTKIKTKTKSKVEESNTKTEEEFALEKITKSLENDKEMFEHMLQDSFLLDVSIVEEMKAAKKKGKKRSVNEDANSDTRTKRIKKSEMKEENSIAAVKPKRSTKKVEKKPKEEPASVQIMKLINSAFQLNDDKLNTSTSSNESRKN
ncbi:repetitive organellar protein-like isoform X2 [Phymastichus coffea]|uniref:repetitive organellar protein-like isoform X2 n=1 Tax=Phymastichus coffea TaxID=108790 RepID=UPI00273B30E7|nr:repetitive organellar protein-like isoform X2 [Phymastichus coffea]